MVLSVVLVSCAGCASSNVYYETLGLKPLPRNKLLSSFDFHTESLPFSLSYYNESDQYEQVRKSNHYLLFPSSLGPIIETTNTRDLSLRFTQGWWDARSWGKLPHNGAFTAGTGVEVVAVIEAPDVQMAKQNWSRLTKILSGFFCASLNSIGDEITTFPKHAVNNIDVKGFKPQIGNKLYLMRAALPSEPVCTENLTPFLKLIPTRGKAGIASLLDGHKLFDSLWHGMSVDVHTECNSDGECFLKLHQTVYQIIDIIRSMRKRVEGGIPKPTPGNMLRCDTNKTFNIWQCFPLGDPIELEWSLETLYGRLIKGAAFEDNPNVSKVIIDVDPSTWNVTKHKENSKWVITNSVYANNTDKIVEAIDEPFSYDFKFATTNSSVVKPIEEPPLHVSRSLTGYSLDRGGLRIAFTNPTNKTVQFTYFESLPWFMRLYISTLKLNLADAQGGGSSSSSNSSNSNNNSSSNNNNSSNNNSSSNNNVEPKDESRFIKERYYRPSLDRARPSHLELVMEVPAHSTLAMTYEFDKSLLLYREYPPDANHGFDVEPAVIIVKDERSGETIYEFRTTSLLLTLPTPDFSMPYNVIILTCTVLSLAFGIVFNLLTKKVVTEEEFELAAQNTKLAKFKKLLRSKLLPKRKIE
ncbi:GPI16 [Candida oxycetoniae]|uniref:GPI16 n=1 Tax=Candida oxycetoniae TaxID=497107 RepID=A0AAI9T1L6_9ASCO|nr:GPI16 [Candida oxycetoniae]KAI3406704.2 GPI16 [Candida oxycetoniae]